MINLIVAGGGEGAYKKLFAATKSTNPDLEMKISTVIDVVPQNRLHPKTQEVLAAENAQYLHVDNLYSLEIPSSPAGIVMTPNSSHLWYANFFASRNIPSCVEKPVVTSIEHLGIFLELIDAQPRLIYGAEYCTDGKALGLLLAGNCLRDDDLRLPYLRIKPGLTLKDVNRFFLSLGNAEHVRGTLLEGSGPAGTADHRPWLLDGVHGGMIRDLASHLFGPLYDIGLASSTVVEPKVALGRYEHGEAPGTFHKLKSAEEGETYALLEGGFSTTSGIIQFHFEVGKYWPKHNRKLELFFENGYAALSYEKPFEFRIESANEVPVIITLEIEHYPTLALLDFKSFMRGQNDGHVGRAAAIVKFNEMMRAVGVRNL